MARRQEGLIKFWMHRLRRHDVLPEMQIFAEYILQHELLDFASTFLEEFKTKYLNLTGAGGMCVRLEILLTKNDCDGVYLAAIE
jgi:hypothetical protein